MSICQQFLQNIEFIYLFCDIRKLSMRIKFLAK